MAFGNEKYKEIVENICPYCGKLLLMNKKTFANHVRWCKSNPKYDIIRNSTISKIKNKNTKKKEYTCYCTVCGKEYKVNCTEHIFNIKKYKKTCSDNCAKILTANKVNKINKNKKIAAALSKCNIITKTCLYCNNVFNTKKEKQQFCSKDCSIKYRKEQKYKNADKKLIIRYYKKCCEFTFALNDYPNEFDFNLIKEYGWYKAKNRGNNLNGISRDHIYSRNKGFENLIDPYLISHPANCQLLRHNDNVSKHIKCDISLEELINKVDNWNKKYGEYPNKIDYSIFESNNIMINKEFATQRNVCSP